MELQDLLQDDYWSWPTEEELWERRKLFESAKLGLASAREFLRDEYHLRIMTYSQLEKVNNRLSDARGSLRLDDPR